MGYPEENGVHQVDITVAKGTRENGDGGRVMHLTGELNQGSNDEVVEEIAMDGSKDDARSQLYVDTEDLNSDGGDLLLGKPGIVRLDPEDVEKIEEMTKSEFVDDSSSRLRVASTMPCGTINLILDETAQKDGDGVGDGGDGGDGDLHPPQTPGLVRTSSEPCVDSKSGKYKDAKPHKKHKISHRKKKRLMRRLGSITDEGAVEINADKGLEFLPDLDDYLVYEESAYQDIEDKKILPLQIAMLIVGTRGDIQPFVAIGKELQKYGHRVRLATHVNFREFVKTHGLEFYPLGGDPKVLAGYMVKNKGFLPSGPKEIKLQRKQIKSIVNSLYPACTEPNEDTLVPFRAQAIIANPPAYGHVHVAEALNVPIHIYFTMPWTPTSEFPHPLSRLSNIAANRLSYQVVDSMIWLGIRSLINDFRKKKLKLRPVSYFKSQGSIVDLPTCYLWSSCLVPKPKDWGPRIDVVGYCFLDLASDYKPSEDLVRWLAQGSKPVYIGFGSLPVKDPVKVTETIISALEKSRQRGLIDKGWGGIGRGMENDHPDFVHFIENCPHDWLFPQCAAVVHHGGAGTTAAGLKAACPTTVVPFFGDQPFWGARVHDRGIGPTPIPIDKLSLDNLVEAIEFMMSPEVKQRAEEVAKCIHEDDGVRDAVKAFHKQLPKVMPQPPRSKSPTSRRGMFNHMCCYST
ncbi:sterol 3-beta-glucosyltransferase UGT80A2 [Selaginella moellendorffii]|uniref:sterol 3-beta-glucosyltransferase UGT80A2 n=1 Tax=Selaginella moellendorffii TaxID=88036 RepID=UPI000D1CC9F0|nr:sterol 3-beta-glucosyltransferase UGT80A2 [Selaginella moellendorffii]|eukprot:XP_024530866.1 sterol 3-beta-glucosyltransferase UGT80A2 [Selaginella moellendorffii]